MDTPQSSVDSEQSLGTRVLTAFNECRFVPWISSLKHAIQGTVPATTRGSTTAERTRAEGQARSRLFSQKVGPVVQRTRVQLPPVLGGGRVRHRAYSSTRSCPHRLGLQSAVVGNTAITQASSEVRVRATVVRQAAASGDIMLLHYPTPRFRVGEIAVVK